jgi:hypothetical protein
LEASFECTMNLELQKTRVTESEGKSWNLAIMCTSLKSFSVYFLLAMSSWSYDCPTYTSNFLFSSTTKDWFPSISCCKMCEDHSSTLSHMYRSSQVL